MNRFLLRSLPMLSVLGVIGSGGLEAQERAREARGDSMAAMPGDGGRAWRTPGEMGGWYAPTSPQRAAEYLEALARAVPGVTLDTLGSVAGPGGAVAGAELPVQVVRVRGGATAPSDPRSGNAAPRVRVLIIGGQRGDEPSSLEASLFLVRELAVGELAELLDRLDVAIVPAVNPWGLLWWVPEEPSGVDPSADHAVLRSPASRGVHRFAASWDPHLVVELREIGPTVYRVQAGLPVHPNVSPDLVYLGRYYLLPYVAHELTRASVSFRELVTVQPEWERRAPLVGGADSLPAGSFFAPGQLGADHALASFALAGRLSLFIGVASLEGVEGLDTRVQLHYLALKALLEVTAGQAVGVTETIEAAARPPVPGMDAQAADATAADTPLFLTLRSRFEIDEEQRHLTWRIWSDVGPIRTQTTDRWRPAVRRLLALSVPAAWVIEPPGEAWADLVRLHGFEVERLSRPVSVEARAYPVGAPDRVPADMAGGLPLDAAPDASSFLVRIRREFPAGTWVVRSAQPGFRLLFTLLEPWSEDAPLGREGKTIRRHGDAGPEARTGLYPVYRVDADALDRLLTEGAPQVSPRADGAG